MKSISAAALAACALCAAAPANGGDEIDAALGERQWVCGKYDLRKFPYELYCNEIVRKDLAADEAWAALKTPQEIRSHQKRLRDAMVAAIGGFPGRTALNVRVVETVKRDGYTIEKIIFESRPCFYVTAHRFVPDPARFNAPYPGAIVPCGHSRSGKLAPWYQRPGVLGAKNGFVTVVYDPIDQGERLQLRSRENLSWGTTQEHNRGGVRAMMLGWNAAQFRIYDGMRAIDVLCEDPRVDSSKIGVFGISGGGTLTSYIMALDERVAAACPAGYLTTMRALADRCGPQDAEQNIFGQLAFGLNHLGYVLARAPSPVLMCCTHSDFFPFLGSIETAARAKRFYSALGAEGNFGLFDVNGPHHWYESQQQASLEWMKKHFGTGADGFSGAGAQLRGLDLGFSYGKVDVGLADIDNPQRHVTEAGKVTGNGFVLDLPGARSVYDIMRGEKIRAKAVDGSLSVADVRRAAGFRAASELDWKAVEISKTSKSGLAIRAVTLVRSDMMRVPTVVFTPENAKGRPVVVVSDAQRTELAGRVRSLLGEGRPVMVAELRAFGETGSGISGHSNGFYGCRDSDEEIAMMCCWLGESLVGHRAEDLICAAEAFSAENGGVPVDVVAEGRAAVPAAHAFFAERKLIASFAAERAPESWAAVLADAQCRPYRFANVVHGALRLYDWTDLAGR